MDLRRLRKGEWITAVSGVVLLVSLFLPWSEIPGEELSGWETFAATDIFLASLGAAAVGVWSVVAKADAPGPGVAFEALLTLLALVMSIVVVVGVGDHEGTGAWLGLAATLGVLVGLLVGMRDERLSRPGRTTDSTGVPAEAPVVQTLPGPPAA